MTPAQKQAAASKLKGASISGLFRAVSAGSAELTKAANAPEALSTCVGNWLSHLDFDGKR